MNKPANIDEYISGFPEATQQLLQRMREIIRKAAPKSQEVISYAMPAFKANGILVYFAGYEHHIGFYPTASGITAFQKEIAAYKSSKGAVQFPLDKPLPIRLITQMVAFRVSEDKEKAERKKSGKKLKG